MRPYTPRKRFRSELKAAGAKATAERVRQHRVYRRALAAGLPEALAAERERDPMVPFKTLRDERAQLSAAELARLKLPAAAHERLSAANTRRVHAECLARLPGARARFRAARAAAIAAQLVIDAMFS